MQQDRFTTKSQEAVTAAQRLAAERHNPEVAPPHLLLALLDQEDGLVVPILQKVGRDVTEVRRAALEAADGLARMSGDAEPDVRPSQAFVRTLQRAERESGSMGDSYISTEHILLALTDRGSGLGSLLPDREAIARAIAE